MPNEDKTGPEGKGSRTGRQLGNCKDTEPQERPLRKGLGRGAGQGRGFRRPRGFGRGRARFQEE